MANDLSRAYVWTAFAKAALSNRPATEVPSFAATKAAEMADHMLKEFDARFERNFNGNWKQKEQK